MGVKIRCKVILDHGRGRGEGGGGLGGEGQVRYALHASGVSNAREIQECVHLNGSVSVCLRFKMANAPTLRVVSCCSTTTSVCKEPLLAPPPPPWLKDAPRNDAMQMAALAQ